MNQNKELSDLIYKDKYLQKGESFEEGMARIAGALTDNKEEFYNFKEILEDQRFLPAGRIQVAVGAARLTTPYNCYVSGTIGDSMTEISHAAQEAMETLKLGGGIGYDFSTLRPSGDLIASLDSTSCGPVGNSVGNNRGFMDWFDAGCAVIRSAGHRRGAQMGVLRVDHPDIRHFIHAKREQGRLTNFNVSVGITDEFMHAVVNDLPFDLRFKGRVYEKISAKNLWDEIMRSTWDHAEPGVLFIDRINSKNNLWYCENIVATNPCGEQPLPPYGACLLGSLNLTKYIVRIGTDHVTGIPIYGFNYERMKRDISYVVPAMDRVIDVAIYPLEAQKKEAQTKRRMGIGVTGLADTLSILGAPYGSPESLALTENILREIRDSAYWTSIRLATERGPFAKLDVQKYLGSDFMQTMPEDIRNEIGRVGIRNSHLLSIAPTGTISLAAGNISSGLEPPYIKGTYNRRVIHGSGEVVEYQLQDYITANKDKYKFAKSLGANEISADAHVDMLNLCSKYVDSSVSKTCNVGDEVTFNEFKDIYLKAYNGGASGCTTFREAGFRKGIMEKTEDKTEEEIVEGAACFIDPDTGQRTCE